MAGYRKLGLSTDQRRAMLRSLVTSFLKHGRIETTETRAKEARSIAEKMITLAKRGDLHARRQVLAYVLEEEVVKTLFDEIAPKYAERNGGYTRMMKKGPRRGDGAEVVILELVSFLLGGLSVKLNPSFFYKYYVKAYNIIENNVYLNLISLLIRKIETL